MNREKCVTTLLVAFVLTACSGLQVQRDLNHADVSQSYKASLSSAVEFVPETACVLQSTTNKWTTIEFSSTTPRVKLPNGLNAAALCLVIPPGSKAIEVLSDAQGGMTYYEIAMVSPSLQFLDSNHKLVKDLPIPRLSPADTLNGLGLRGVIVLTTDLAQAQYAVVYVHPNSLDGSVTVQTGVAAIPVPFAPYGKVKLRFQ